jgi:cytochrome P450
LTSAHSTSGSTTTTGIPVETDPSLQRDIRNALNPLFTPNALGQSVVGEINRIANRLMTECLEQEGPVDLVASFTAKLPPLVFGPAFLDSTEEEGNRLLNLVNTLLTRPELVMEVAPKLLPWCAELLQSRRAEGRREDLAGIIAHMGFGEDGLKLDEKQRVEIINFVVMAGIGDYQRRPECQRLAARHPARPTGAAADGRRAHGRPGHRGVPALRVAGPSALPDADP